MKYGAATVHRTFGIPVGYIGPWRDRTTPRYVKILRRLKAAQMFVLDEISMIGRQMLGKIDYRVSATVSAEEEYGCYVSMGGRDVVVAGDWKQAQPIGEEPLYKVGPYGGKGLNKPSRGERPGDAPSMEDLTSRGVLLREEFEDVGFFCGRYTG
jgi:hypothetical protein